MQPHPSQTSLAAASTSHLSALSQAARSLCSAAPVEGDGSRFFGAILKDFSGVRIVPIQAHIMASSSPRQFTCTPESTEESPEKVIQEPFQESCTCWQARSIKLHCSPRSVVE